MCSVYAANMLMFYLTTFYSHSHYLAQSGHTHCLPPKVCAGVPLAFYHRSNARAKLSFPGKVFIANKHASEPDWLLLLSCSECCSKENYRMLIKVKVQLLTLTYLYTYLHLEIHLQFSLQTHNYIV